MVLLSADLAIAGDGAGILVAMPDNFLSSVMLEEQGLKLPPLGQYAVGQLFMPRDELQRSKCREVREVLVHRSLTVCLPSS